MRKLMLKYLALFFLVSLMACSGKQEAAEESASESAVESEDWAMMDEFHMVMAQSFHPFKDSANIEPAIAHAEEMAAMAEKWSNSELPERVNNESVKADLEALKNATGVFVQTSQSGDAEQIGAALTELHDLFHKLQEAWYGGHDHQH